MSRKRKFYALVTIFALSALMIAGTFAWTNFNAQIVNVFRGLGTGSGGTDPIGPGGTLHNDHSDGDENRQVYIENWGSEPLFVRIRLDEYMELGSGAGYKSKGTNPESGESIPHPENLAESVVSSASIDVLDSWTTHIPCESTPHECDTIFHDYWQWEMGGQKFFYPAPEGSREDPSFVATGSPANLTEESINTDGIYAVQTLLAEVLTMAQWLEQGATVGDYWVIDTDGWAYWAVPLEPGNATGLLLNRVTQIKQPEKDYYYGINVIAQMATKNGDDLGNGSFDNYTRFGDPANGGWSEDGKALINKIVYQGQIDLTGHAIRVGNFPGPVMPISGPGTILSTHDDYISYFMQYRYLSNAIRSNIDLILNKYNEGFFEHKSLAVVYVLLDSTDHTIEYESSIITGNIIRIKYEVDRSVPITIQRRCGYFVIVEVDKNISNVVANEVGTSNNIVHVEPASYFQHGTTHISLAPSMLRGMIYVRQGEMLYANGRVAELNTLAFHFLWGDGIEYTADFTDNMDNTNSVTVNIKETATVGFNDALITHERLHESNIRYDPHGRPILFGPRLMMPFVVIPAESEGVVFSRSHRVYVYYGDGRYRELREKEVFDPSYMTLGPIIDIDGIF